MINQASLEANLKCLQDRIRTACEQANRSLDEVSILPVTKTHSSEIIGLAKSVGFTSVGENRVQEASEKKKRAATSMSWELIGHLQSNKSHQAVETFDRIQSVDSMKLIKRLDSAAKEQDRAISILLQFNTGEDPAKYGAKVSEADAMISECLSANSLELEGFMTIAPLDKNPDVALKAFIKLRELRDGYSEKYKRPMPELSMGMSGDLEQAIMAGSTMIRVGSALFGTRPKL